MFLAALGFVLLVSLPTDFANPVFGLILLLIGIAMGMFAPISILFAAFLGYNPIEHLLGYHALASLSAHDQAVLTGHSFFSHLIAGPFRDGLHTAFAFAIVACLVAAAASLMRGGRPDSDPDPRTRVSAELSRA